jgi:hypothetical protein
MDDKALRNVSDIIIRSGARDGCGPGGIALRCLNSPR